MSPNIRSGAKHKKFSFCYKKTCLEIVSRYNGDSQMSKINIVELEIFCRVGISDEAREKSQCFLVTLDMDYDFSSAAISDRINRTIDYGELMDRLKHFGERRTWKLMETLATDIANKVLKDFHPERVTVELKRFPAADVRYVSVLVTREQLVFEDFKRPWWWGGWR